MKKKLLGAAGSMLMLSACVKTDPAQIDLPAPITAVQASESDDYEGRYSMPLKSREFTNIAYEEDSPLQKFDLYLPEEGQGPFPLVFFIHGGGWYCGDKQDGQEKAFTALRNKGFAVASTNYRLSPEASCKEGLDDCRQALAFLQEHAEMYHLDENNFFTAGDSSGGQYALMMALDSDYASQNNIRGSIAWYAPTDLAACVLSVLSGEYEGFGADYFMENLSRSFGEDERNLSVLDELSPVRYIHEGMPAILLQHGTADQICPLSQSELLVDQAKTLGLEDKVRLDVFENAGHLDEAFESEENIEALASFLNAQLVPSA